MPPVKALVYLTLALAGCATAARDAGGQGSPDGGGLGGGHPDGGVGKDADTTPPVDAAPLPDAPMGQTQVTLSQTNDMMMAAGKSVACRTLDPIFGTIVLGTSDNSWYRVFKLADYGITGPFNLQRVTFWTDYASAGTGTTQPATLRVGTYAGSVEADTLNTSQITNVGTAQIQIPDADSANGTPPPVETNISATVPVGSNLIVELALPEGGNDGNYFYIGVTAGGESKKSYIRSANSLCNITPPKALTSPGGLNKPDNSILLTVTGTK